jgi:two-component system nitrate/nitrite response regulator NarL
MALKMTLEMEEDIEVIGEVDDWLPLELATKKFHPDVILMDIRMHSAQGNNDGIAAARQIRLHHPQIAVIILTMLPSKELGSLAQQAGASGLVLKDERNQALLQSIRSAAQSVLPPVGAFPILNPG